MKKPDKQIFLQTIGAVEDLIFGAKSLVQNKYRETVNADYALFMEAEIETALLAIPIERISEAGLGIRTAVICEAGVDNMAQLLKMTKKELIKIQGVGERSAFQAMAVALSLNTALMKSSLRGIRNLERSMRLSRKTPCLEMKWVWEKPSKPLPRWATFRQREKPILW